MAACATPLPLVDVVVVYKIDRLSRSLMDFSKLVEVFDRNGVTFVSVTQSFNTTTSMGRLTLNILLSFAQFEREVTAERIRDKVAASRKKGIFMGGNLPLGYDVKDRKLVIVPAEAEVVCNIFTRFVEIGSGTTLARVLYEAGVANRQGKRIDKKFIYRLLNNRVYIGEAVHKGDSYAPPETRSEAKVWRRSWIRTSWMSACTRIRAQNRLRSTTGWPGTSPGKRNGQPLGISPARRRAAIPSWRLNHTISIAAMSSDFRSV